MLSEAVDSTADLDNGVNIVGYIKDHNLVVGALDVKAEYGTTAVNH